LKSGVLGASLLTDSVLNVNGALGVRGRATAGMLSVSASDEAMVTGSLGISIHSGGSALVQSSTGHLQAVAHLGPAVLNSVNGALTLNGASGVSLLSLAPVPLSVVSPSLFSVTSTGSSSLRANTNVDLNSGLNFVFNGETSTSVSSSSTVQLGSSGASVTLHTAPATGITTVNSVLEIQTSHTLITTGHLGTDPAGWTVTNYGSGMFHTTKLVLNAPLTLNAASGYASQLLYTFPGGLVVIKSVYLSWTYGGATSATGNYKVAFGSTPASASPLAADEKDIVDESASLTFTNPVDMYLTGQWPTPGATISTAALPFYLNFGLSATGDVELATSATVVIEWEFLYGV